MGKLYYQRTITDNEATTNPARHGPSQKKKMYIVHIHRNVHIFLKNLWELIHSLWINWNP